MKCCFCVVCCIAFLFHPVLAAQKDNNLDSAIISLSSVEVDAYLTGKDLGFDRLAEANHFPHPKRVLQMKNTLGLNAAQKKQATMLYRLMRKHAIQAGREIVQKEKELDELFQQPDIDLKAVKSLVMEIAALKGKVRFTHLKAHVIQKEYLSSEQIIKYNNMAEFDPSTVYAFDE